MDVLAMPQTDHFATARTLRIGTRGSPLALVQARAFRKILEEIRPVPSVLGAVEESIIRTTGDITQASGQRLADVGGKGLFAKEIHEALHDGRVDVAVHSLKDLETALPDGIVLACTLRREDARDTLIINPDIAIIDSADPYASLPLGARIGSSSVRRQAQMLHARPDLLVETVRGNVQNRLDKVKRGDFAASLLALAGLRRLGLAHEASVIIDADIMVPSACQGIVGVTVRADDTDLREMLALIEDSDARDAAAAERALLGSLDGSCHTPIGGYASLDADGALHLTGLIARADGTFLLKKSLRGARSDAERLGRELGASLRRDTPKDVFAT